MLHCRAADRKQWWAFYDFNVWITNRTVYKWLKQSLCFVQSVRTIILERERESDRAYHKCITVRQQPVD